MRLFAGMCLLLLCACDAIPSDPGKTLEHVRKRGSMRVALVHNPPFVDTRASPPAGSEVELLRAFAESLHVEPRFKKLSLGEGFDALEHGQIDVLAGGLTQATPYTHAAFTRPWRIDQGEDGKRIRHVLALPRGENRFLVTLENFVDTREAPR